MSDELQTLLASKPNIAEKTKKNYKTLYTKWTAEFDKPLHKVSEEFLLKIALFFSNGNPESENTYLNFPIMVLRLYDMPTDKLVSRRDELKQLRVCYMQQQNDKKRDTLPSYKELTNYANDLYKSEKWENYIVNYLLLNYGVRNKDVDVFLTTVENKDVTDRNLLVVKENKIDWIVNDYKTFKNYGVKRFVIKNKKFIHAVNQLGLDRWLFQTKNGEHIQDNSLGKTLSRMTYNEIGEISYFKAVMVYVNKSKNTMQKMEKFSKSRGTNMNTLIGFYDVSKKCEE